MEVKVIASGSDGNCYLVTEGADSILLDAGISLKRIQIGCDFNLHAVLGCLVTHHHSDHSKAISGLLNYGISVYMPQKEIESMHLQTHHYLHPLKNTSDYQYDLLRVGGFTIRPFTVEHDTPEPVGYLVQSESKEKLLYFTDTFYLKHRFAGINIIIGECNYDRETMWDAVESGTTHPTRAKRLFRTHMSLENFEQFLRANDTSNLRQIFICHMSKDHGNREKIESTVKSLVNAEVTIC